MKRSQVNEMVLAGEKIHVVEFRSYLAERIKYRDKETKTVMELGVLQFACESGKGAFSVSQRVEEGFDPLKYVCPFKRGQSVVLQYSGCSMERGKTTYNGTLELIEEDGAGVLGVLLPTKKV